MYCKDCNKSNNDKICSFCFKDFGILDEVDQKTFIECMENSSNETKTIE